MLHIITYYKPTINDQIKVTRGTSCFPLMVDEVLVDHSPFYEKFIFYGKNILDPPFFLHNYAKKLPFNIKLTDTYQSFCC